MDPSNLNTVINPNDNTKIFVKGLGEGDPTVIKIDSMLYSDGKNIQKYEGTVYVYDYPTNYIHFHPVTNERIRITLNNIKYDRVKYIFPSREIYILDSDNKYILQNNCSDHKCMAACPNYYLGPLSCPQINTNKVKKLDDGIIKIMVDGLGEGIPTIIKADNMLYKDSTGVRTYNAEVYIYNYPKNFIHYHPETKKAMRIILDDYIKYDHKYIFPPVEKYVLQIDNN